MFESVEDVQQRFRDARYIASRRISTVVYLAARMGRRCSSRARPASARPSWPRRCPTSPAAPLIRLQCYEGLDEGKALYEWKYAKQLLYTQLLRERIGELIADAPSLPDAVSRIAGQDDAFFSYRFLSPRPLLPAIRSDEPVRAADRRDRQGGAGVRGVPARGALGLPGLGARAGHDQGASTCRSWS